MEDELAIGQASAALVIAITILSGLIAPMASSEPVGNGGDEDRMAELLSNFDPGTDGKSYLMSEGAQDLFSATTYLKKKWAEEGYPGLVLPIDKMNKNSRGSQRSCENAWVLGDSDNITTSDGTISATVERTSANAAVFVEDGKIVSSTTLNDITSTWESIIFPTDTNYFGDAPDLDNNCQIEIVIHSIDGVGGTGGYFQPGLSPVRESLFMDIDDLGSRNFVLSHEFGHLIHNAWDPFEYLWIVEGAAEMAEYLCFGTNSELESNANSWTGSSNSSLRWWNERGSDHGSGFLFLMYLADKLGGAPSIRSLISDSSIGGSGIENLARNPGSGSTPIGGTMSEIFANFSAAVTLDSSQGAYGFSDLDLEEDCTGGGFCRISESDSNDQWGEVWQSSGHSMEGWGLSSFRFTQGTGEPLSLMVQPDRFGFEGVLMVREASSGTWTMDELRIEPSTGIGTGLIHGFGNSTSEAWLLIWYNSGVDDCDFDFANCGILPGGAYPTGSFTVNAGLVTEPASVSIDSIEVFDRDEDGLGDSLEVSISVSSSAYFETLEVEVDALVNNTVVDSETFSLSASNDEAVSRTIWFTPQFSADVSFVVRVRDITGELQDLALSLPGEVFNMKPIGSGSISTNYTETWIPTYIFGGGFDQWGFGLSNGSFNQNETPASYIWGLGDGNSSTLKNPIHSYVEEGSYVISLVIVDQGGFFSDMQTWNLSVNDSSTPIPEISIGGIPILEEITVKTNQRIQFSSFGTSDNVPIDRLSFSWDWGDGTIDSGVGLFEIGHAWVDGNSNGTMYSVVLGVSDGTQSSEETVLVRVMNRAPRLVLTESLQTYALTPLSIPDVFTDDDGILVEHRWTFDEGVNLGGGSLSLASEFRDSESFLQNPIIAWREPGLKNITLEVTDDDGNSTIAILQVEVMNQRPVSIFDRPDDGDVDTAYIFNSASFDPDGDSSSLVHVWTISDMENMIENVSSVSRTFSKPGLYSVSLVVIDERGLQSAPKTYLFSIANPLPFPVLEFSCPSVDGTIIEEIPGEGDPVSWQVPHTSSGGAFVAPGHVIRFDGSASYDADPEFEGKSSIQSSSPDWNGIGSWIWDFGDASPSETGPIVWHSYERAGEYLVRLTVVDGFAEGESNTTEMMVIVSQAPTIGTVDPIGMEYVVEGDSVILLENASDPDEGVVEAAWIDEDALFDSDDDGNPTNDRDRELTGELIFQWDLDVFSDYDCLTIKGCDGNTRNDWIQENQTWGNPGEVRISMEVCDGVGVCASMDYVVTVLSIQDTSSPKTLSDLTLEDLVPGKESAVLLALVSLVAILGWMIMREKDEEELDAKGMVENYEVDEVLVEGGLPGMDQHSPPPQPTYLTSDERRDRESGYVRPIRTRRK
ncbi:MAG TPA: PKD domain-containing protein [Candidatus Thalassarchaeaceae archaeon]|nr:PKD domain-containing protein [Candidatus Thalassarchaeaceae archaeon]